MFKLFCFCRYVVDAADRENMAIAKGELHDLLSKPSLTGIPLLVIGNKIDKPEAFPKQTFTELMYAHANLLHSVRIFFFLEIPVRYILLIYCLVNGIAGA
jgi:hypothetical protein